MSSVELLNRLSHCKLVWIQIILTPKIVAEDPLQSGELATALRRSLERCRCKAIGPHIKRAYVCKSGNDSGKDARRIAAAQAYPREHKRLQLRHAGEEKTKG